MKSLWSIEGLDVLKRAAASKTLLAFDFDGTLAPIVAERHAANMSPETRKLWQTTCLAYPTAVLSGRGRADVAGRLGDAHVKYIVGNHGAEWGAESPQFERAMNEARAVLEPLARNTPGIDIEDKRFTLAVHYRRARLKAATQRTILQALSTVSARVRIIQGKCVVNVVPVNALNKGDSVLELRRLEGAAGVVFVGDDVTDEDAFRINQPQWFTGIRVGRSMASAAAFFIRNQGEIDRLLRLLISLRSDSTREAQRPTRQHPGRTRR